MGYGDFKLLAALGAWLGWQMLPLVILLSAVVGAVVGMALIAGGRLATRADPVRALPRGRRVGRAHVRRAADSCSTGDLFLK